MMRRRLEVLRPLEHAGQLPRIVDEHWQMLRADADVRAAVLERKQRHGVGGAVAEEAGGARHGAQGTPRYDGTR